MKSKRTTYIMLLVVVGIWGLIGFKIWKGLQGDDDFVAPGGDKLVTPKNRNTPDTFSLLANYRDPFLGKTQTISAPNTFTASTSPKEKQVIAKPEPIVNTWPEMRYGGFVKKSGQDKAAGFLSIAGSSEIVSPGQQVREFTVGRIWRDSVEVMRGKEKKIIRK